MLPSGNFSLPKVIARLIAAIMLMFASPCLARGEPAGGPIQYLPGIAGDYFRHDSKALGRPLHIYVKLPESYDSDLDRRYPVSYVLDGDTLYPMLAPAHLFLHYDDKLPEAVIVGIAYGSLGKDVNMRHFDFWPVLEDGSPGGSAAFLTMLENELLPAISAQYRVDDSQRTLFGQSRGGSFVLYAANQRPGLFRGYIASNPGRETDKHLYGWNSAPVSAKSGSTLVVTSGSRDRDYLRDGAEEWGGWIAGSTDLPWTAHLVRIKGGTHAASAVQAYRAGMMRVFGLIDAENSDEVGSARAP